MPRPFFPFSKLPGSKGMRWPSWRPTVPLPIGVTLISCTRSRTHANCMVDLGSVALASRSCTRSWLHRRRRQGAGRKALSQQWRRQSRAVNSMLPILIVRSYCSIVTNIPWFMHSPVSHSTVPSLSVLRSGLGPILSILMITTMLPTSVVVIMLLQFVRVCPPLRCLSASLHPFPVTLQALSGTRQPHCDIIVTSWTLQSSAESLLPSPVDVGVVSKARSSDRAPTPLIGQLASANFQY